jgi:hypothetical protein
MLRLIMLNIIYTIGIYLHVFYLVNKLSLAEIVISFLSRCFLFVAILFLSKFYADFDD